MDYVTLVLECIQAWAEDPHSVLIAHQLFQVICFESISVNPIFAMDAIFERATDSLEILTIDILVPPTSLFPLVYSSGMTGAAVGTQSDKLPSRLNSTSRCGLRHTQTSTGAIYNGLCGELYCLIRTLARCAPSTIIIRTLNQIPLAKYSSEYPALHVGHHQVHAHHNHSLISGLVKGSGLTDATCHCYCRFPSAAGNARNLPKHAPNSPSTSNIAVYTNAFN